MARLCPIYASSGVQVDGVLPPGMRVSDDPFPAARSAAYAVSYNRRTAEEKDYPRQATGGAR